HVALPAPGRVAQAAQPTETPNGALMLSVQNRRVTYGRSGSPGAAPGARMSAMGSILALRGVSLDLPAGGVLAVLGSNGAGKTTLLRAISGVLGEYGGSVIGHLIHDLHAA